MCKKDAFRLVRYRIHACLVVPIREFIRMYLQRAPWYFAKRALYAFYRKHIAWMPYSRIVRTQFGLKMRVSMPDFISETIYLTGKWEPIITHYVEEVLKEGDIFIDVGANIGYYSLLASKFVGTKGAVIALEASPAIYDQLKDNISLNIVSKSCVRTINAAASNVRGELGLYVGPQENAGHSTTVEALAVKSGMRMEARVRSDCLEELVGKDSLLGARLIKIDVEGAERVVLEPYLSRLGEFSHDTEWLIELSAENCAGGQADVAAIFDAFTSNGYAVYRFPDWRDWKFRLSPYTGGISFKRLFSLPTGESSDVLMTRRRFE